MKNTTFTDCQTYTVFDRLFALLNNSNTTDCIIQESTTEMQDVYRAGRNFYTYFTPILIFVGVIGNSFSLYVFLSINFRPLSTSTYLFALSGSDLFTTIFYVTVEWIRRGYTYIYPGRSIHFLDITGVCEIQLYLSYISRFVSAWILVCFTVDRYVVVCRPLLRRKHCTARKTRKIVAGVFLLSSLIVLYKPFLSGVYKSDFGNLYCTANPMYKFVSFVCDSVFALMISLVPSLIIIILNTIIITKLAKRKSYRNRRKIITQENVIRLELTKIYLCLSLCFIAFNVPYFVLWCRNFLTSKYITLSVTYSFSDVNVKYWQGILYFVRTIFYMNYCVNFIVYLVTGTCFRQEIGRLFLNKHSKREKQQSPFLNYSYTKRSTSYQGNLNGSTLL